MTRTNLHRRAAAALAAALLAGGGTAWLTRPAASSPSTSTSLGAAVSTPAATALAKAGPRSTAASAPASATATATAMATASATRGGGTAKDTSTARTTNGAAAAPTPASRVTPLLGTPAPPAVSTSTGRVPTSFAVPELGIRMPVEPEGVAASGEMALRPDPAELAWYRHGPRPGDAQGAVVLAAHLDAPGYGIGPLAEVHRLRPGDLLTVTAGGVVHRYTVLSVQSVAKADLDLDALFARSGPPRLHVVTCGGDFDEEQRRYDHNVVVSATPLR